MIFLRVSDLSWDDTRETKYDLAFFASGYEERSTYIPRQLERPLIKTPVILGFKELHRETQRRANDRYFHDEWTADQVPISTDDDTGIYTVLQALAGVALRRILVDCSSMSRVWYCAILNWARYCSSSMPIEIDFVYSPGEHKERVAPMVIKDIVALPGFEGGPSAADKAVAIFGLGFEGLAPLCVLDRLEPDEVYAYLASPGAFRDYPRRARAANAELIRQSRTTLELPLDSVERTFGYLTELVVPHRGKANVTMVPMGPKPHVLAAMLVALRFRDIACLRVSGRRERSEQVKGTDGVVAARVTFVPEPSDSQS